MKDLDDGVCVGHYHCISPEIDGMKDHHGSDSMAVYEHVDSESGEVWYDAFCWSECNCKFTKEQLVNSSVGSELGLTDKPLTKPINGNPLKPKREPITSQQYKDLISRTRCDLVYRNIKPKYLEFYGHRLETDSLGNIIKVWYPETNKDYDGEVKSLMGYKCRTLPKGFGGNIGKCGISNDLSGMHKFKSGGKYVLITAGENCKAAAMQMFDENLKSSEDYGAIPVVSPTTGEGGCANQASNCYDWLDTFENIVVGLDNDDVGRAATLKVCESLPKEKVLIANWSMKDVHAMLEAGKPKMFISDFFNAKPYYNSGIVSSGECFDPMVESLQRKSIPLPPFAWRMQSMTPRGEGLPLGAIINLIGNTSIGKSSLVNRFVYHWIFNSEYKVGVVSLENTAGEYTADMMSIHLGVDLANMSREESKDYLDRPDIKRKADKLLYREDGSSRFHVIDERDGSITRLEEQIERLRKQYGCQLIVIDVLTDITRSAPMDEQDKHLQWQKNTVKDDCSIFNVLHTRKPKDSEELNEYHAYGSSTFVQSAAVNILIDRDKMAECEVDRNTTKASLPKCRRGKTGPAGEFYFDQKAQQFWDLVDYLNEIKPNESQSAETITVNTDTGEVLEYEKIE